jgi:hypothetical protein
LSQVLYLLYIIFDLLDLSFPHPPIIFFLYFLPPKVLHFVTWPFKVIRQVKCFRIK